MADELTLSSYIRGFHVYREIWTPVIGEVLTCKRQPSNMVDRYAVRVVKGTETVGHLPKKILKIFSLFIRRGGMVTCEVTGTRRRSTDLIQGGLEIPCLLKIHGE